MIIEKTENGIYKMLDLSELPKKKWGDSEVIDWRKIESNSIPFTYGAVRGNMVIEYSYSNEKGNFLYLSYDGTTALYSDRNIRRAKIGNLFKQKVPKEYTSYLKNIKDRELLAGSSKKISCLCPSCGFEKKMIVKDLTRRGFSCSVCSETVSYPERFVATYLTILNLRFEKQKVFKGVSGFRFDFYVPSLNIIIETHGMQHYAPINFGRTTPEKEELFKKQQQTDREKKNFCELSGLTYVEIDCRFSDSEHISRSINNTGKLIKISESMLKRIESQMEYNSNFPKNRVAKALQKGKTKKEIADTMGIHYATLSRKLKKLKFKQHKNGKPIKKIVCVNTKTIHEDVQSVAKLLERTVGSVYKNLQRDTSFCGKHPVTGEKLKWMYYEDYIEKYGTEGLTEYLEEPEKQIN